LWGGVTDAGSEVWHQGRRSLEGDLVRDNLFGEQLAALDLDGDGYDDLLVAASPTAGVDLVWKGELHMIPGSASGLTGKGDVRCDQDTPGVLGVAQWHDQFGEGLP
jgi:hypothetical protein